MAGLKVVSVNQEKSILYLLSSCITFYFTRSSLPFFKYPFLVLFAFLALVIITGHRDKIYTAFRESVRTFYIPLFLFFFLVASCFLSGKIYLIVVKDISNAFILLVLFYFARVFVRTENDLRDFLTSLINVIICISVLISFQRVYQYLFVSSYFDQYSDLYISPYREAVDYNFALVPVFFGMTGILYLFRKRQNTVQLWLFTFLLYWFSFSFIISGSKRGLAAFFAIFIALVIFNIRTLVFKDERYMLFYRNTRYYLAALTVSVVLIIIVFLNSSVYFKNDLLKKTGVRNVPYTKVLISETLFRYFHFFISDNSADGIYEKIWHPVFDPKDPAAGRGNGNYKVTGVLTGAGEGLFPDGTKGYLLDSTCLGFASGTHAYYFHELRTEKVNTGDSVLAAVACFVSEDFNGNGVALRAEGSINGNPDMFYDLGEKGKWKKLILPLSCNQGSIKVFIYMNKADVSDFSSLKGYVIFAYPEYLHFSSGDRTDTSSISRTVKNTKPSTDFVSETACLTPGNVFRDGKHTETAGMFYLPLTSIEFLNAFTIAKDPIRTFVSGLVSEDTTWHGFRSDIKVTAKNDKLGEDRIERWKFAGRIFFKEYTLSQKLFGGGFNFLNWYGYCFLNDKTKSDWPHNPFLSVLLYSGVLGLILYCFFLAGGGYYYFKYKGDSPLLFVFFLISFYFSFFSAGSPFDPPVMGFFALLPFFINSVHKQAGYSSIG